MADLLELLVRKLRLECVDKADRGLAGGVRDDVELDRWLRHARSVTRERSGLRMEIHEVVANAWHFRALRSVPSLTPTHPGARA
jgi:hypothetical protein